MSLHKEIKKLLKKPSKEERLLELIRSASELLREEAGHSQKDLVLKARFLGFQLSEASFSNSLSGKKRSLSGR